MSPRGVSQLACYVQSRGQCPEMTGNFSLTNVEIIPWITIPYTWQTSRKYLYSRDAAGLFGERIKSRATYTISTLHYTPQCTAIVT